jgi:hypothetical protein
MDPAGPVRRGQMMWKIGDTDEFGVDGISMIST